MLISNQVLTQLKFVSSFMLYILYDGDVLDGDDFSFIHPPRSISSLLLVVLFKVYAIDAYIYCTH